MKKLRCLPLITISLLTLAVSADAQEKQPNIIIYMVDDLGWNHVSAGNVTMNTHKKLYHTPNLEKLAQDGLSFTHAYQQPNCAPTRAAIISGQYPARVHNDVYVVGSLNRVYGEKKLAELHFKGPEQTEDVAAEAITIAEALCKNGYTTAHIGKYHVGGNEGEDTLPENVGFDINIGGYSQGHQKNCFASEKDGTWNFAGTGRGDFGKYASPYTQDYVKKHNFPAELIGKPKHITDALGDALEETITTLNAGGKPFYIQFNTYAVHGPVRSRPDLKQKAAQRLGKNVNSKMLEYVGFIDSVDINLGRLLAAVNDPNGDGDTSDSIADNTFILFTSDNGGTHADNLPLTGVKGMFTEGGIRVPAIAYWPGKIPANTVTDYRIHGVDYYPTWLALAGNKWLPPESEHPLDGESFADILSDPTSKRVRKPLFFLFPGYMDYRAEPCVVVIDDIQGERYKLFYYYEANSWELYCLTDDQEEANNIIADHPDIASALSVKINDWLNQKHPTWKPKYPLDKKSGKPVPPPTFKP